MTEALTAATSAVEGKISKSLKKLLKNVVGKETEEALAVADAKLGSSIKEKLQISCLTNTSVQELMRCIRSQADSLITGAESKEMSAMALGLAHSLSRYKLKFSPDKIDTMIVQAVSLLDDLDKELNNYIMRGREWYGWHFPELGKIVTDNLAFMLTVKAIGMRTNTATTDLSEILPEEVEEKVKEAAEISMGTEIADEDIENIKHLCDQVIEITEYRAQLYEYLKARMTAVAPNLTILVGELVGARLISHAGSLMNLAKQPASTVQILGAEKALFRALKTKHDTPKYGLIYHAQLVSQSSAKLKGKVSRGLANKAALASRVDALGEDGSTILGVEHRAKLESHLRMLEDQGATRISGTGMKKSVYDKYFNQGEVLEYKQEGDFTIPHGKRRASEGAPEDGKPKKMKVEVVEEIAVTEPAPEGEKKKKKKKSKGGEEEAPVEELKEVSKSPKKTLGANQFMLKSITRTSTPSETKDAHGHIIERELE
ncbi:hypothetical protein QYM36_002045 [Artemia franciscana]|uniref:Nucleolar protein 58 n=1 Tax=Artemia franciscana TaxID=6661 RepID=A0AA88LGJ6_ARTSF|nr:hypothetical protein QYM36_002045 [Artemia franciscana]